MAVYSVMFALSYVVSVCSSVRHSEWVFWFVVVLVVHAVLLPSSCCTLVIRHVLQVLGCALNPISSVQRFVYRLPCLLLCCYNCHALTSFGCMSDSVQKNSSPFTCIRSETPQAKQLVRADQQRSRAFACRSPAHVCALVISTGNKKGPAAIHHPAGTST